MKTAAFIADSPAAALAQIHAELGPEAVVLSVRPLPVQGLARFLPGRRPVEVLAGVPEREPESLAQPWPTSLFAPPLQPPQPALPDGRWRSVAWLAEMGLLPLFAERLRAQLNAHSADNHPDSIEAEWETVCATLASAWRPPPPLDEEIRPARPHVFIGPPGSGKTTALCKWLTQAVLLQDCAASVWRLDAGTANSAEFLSLHCEMLGVPVERFWSESRVSTDLSFVDFPGADVQDPAAMTALRNQIATLPSPRLHLVLNAAYETNILLAQYRAFEPLQPEDVILTHCDEELHRIKLWNLVLGTNCSFRFLSGGQKIPGEFRAASPAQFFPIQNRR